jgi:hypothetical protein
VGDDLNPALVLGEFRGGLGMREHVYFHVKGGVSLFHCGCWVLFVQDSAIVDVFVKCRVSDDESSSPHLADASSEVGLSP